MAKHFRIILLGLILVAILSCGVYGFRTTKASGGYHASRIPSEDGSLCYVILNDRNEAMGGNCK